MEQNKPNWERTDDTQLVKIHSDNRFEFLELLQLNDVHVINHDIIDYTDYTEEGITKHIEGYGYDSIEHVKKLYPDESYKQIICECIFETSEDTRLFDSLNREECIALLASDFGITWDEEVALK